MKKHIAKILRQIAEEKSELNSKSVYKKLKKAWRQNKKKISVA